MITSKPLVKVPVFPQKQKLKKITYPNQHIPSSVQTNKRMQSNYNTLDKKKYHLQKQNSNSKMRNLPNQNHSHNINLILTESENENKSNIINTNHNNESEIEEPSIASVPASSGRNKSKPLLMKSEKLINSKKEQLLATNSKARARESSVKERRHLLNAFGSQSLSEEEKKKNENLNNNSKENEHSNNNKENRNINDSNVINKRIHHGMNTSSTSKITTNKFHLKHHSTAINNSVNTNNVSKRPLVKNEKEDSEYFDYADERPIELTKEEKDVFGNREMKGYHKIRLLGKGGCGVVWLCTSKISNEECAVKQISKKNCSTAFSFAANNTMIAKNEIQILTQLNSIDKCPYIVEIYDNYEDNNDIWFAFEKGGKCLSNLSFKIKGEFLKNERIYSIKKGRFLKLLFSHVDQLKILIKKLLLGIDFINSQGIVHADIKPENILIDYIDEEAIQNEDTKGKEEQVNQPLLTNFLITKVKIIDFGSAFFTSGPSAISSNTPEYLCPEITEILEGKNKNKKSFFDQLQSYPSCVDIWSLGVTLLELVLACPVWMSYKAKITINGKNIFKTGLFGFKGRDGNKINHKQTEVSNNLHKLLNQSLLYNFSNEERELFEDLLGKMLSSSYKTRITPKEALNHPFLKDVI